jgi:hypothetical protein
VKKTSEKLDRQTKLQLIRAMEEITKSKLIDKDSISTVKKFIKNFQKFGSKK